MWKLTIEQITKETYSGGTYDKTQQVIYKSEDRNELLLTVSYIARHDTIGTVKYTIEKESEE